MHKDEEDQLVKWDEEGSSEEELVCADQGEAGEALVVHCSLNTTMVVDKEEWLCHNIFQTK